MDFHEIVEELNKRGKHIWNLSPKIRKYLSTNDKVKDIDLSEWDIEDLVELCQSINIDPFNLASNV